MTNGFREHYDNKCKLFQDQIMIEKAKDVIQTTNMPDGSKQLDLFYDYIKKKGV
jgi:hypothetical protein